MVSKNITVFTVISAILFTAILFGVYRSNPVPARETTTIAKQAADATEKVPYLGKIQVLNGCGEPGAANIVADSLRKKSFDVKDIGNAPTSNYESTMVISRTKDMTMAKQVAQMLKTDQYLLVRNEDQAYDVTVIIGHDFKERLK